MLLFLNLVSQNTDAFQQKVIDISKKLGINPDWLMLAMKHESGINSKAQNSTTNATGLIQFMPDTAAQYGISTAELYNMSNLDQLDYVYKYLSRFAGQMKTFADVYLAIFFPAATGKGKDYILQTSGASAAAIAKSNSGFDLNGDGKITRGELDEYIQKRMIKTNVPADKLEAFNKPYNNIMEKISNFAIAAALLILVVVFVLKGVKS